MGRYGNSTGLPFLRKFFRTSFGFEVGGGFGDFGGLADLEGYAVRLGCRH